MTTPILGLTELEPLQSQPHVVVNAALRALEAVVQISVISIEGTPPGSPSEGDRYIVDSGATGDWSGHDGELAYYASGWQFLAPRDGWIAYVENLSATYQYSGGSAGSWSEFSGSGGGSSGLVLQVACSDLTTNLTTGAGKGYVRAPRGFTLADVRASLLTGSSSGNVVVDINVNGSTILSTKLTIDEGEKTSTTADTPAVISNAVITDDDEITFDIDDAGSGAKGLIVTLIGTT